MNLVGFIHRHSLPNHPIAGYFYWIDVTGEEPQVWFSPTNETEDMVLLNDKDKIDELIELISGANSDIEDINERLDNLKDEILNELDLSAYATKSWVEGKGYLTEIELGDSDYDEITDRVNENLKLTWKVI